MCPALGSIEAGCRQAIRMNAPSRTQEAMQIVNVNNYI